MEIEKASNKVQGRFSYRLRDVKTGEILQEFVEPNKIMNSVPKMFFEMVTGIDESKSTVNPPHDEPSTITAADFFLTTFAIGDQGFIKEDGRPREIDRNEEVLHSMYRDENSKKFAGTTYQATWSHLETHDWKQTPPGGGQPASIGLDILTEGACDPEVGYNGGGINNLPKFNSQGMNMASSLHAETGLDVISEIKDGILTLQIHMLEKTGNGIDFSEAALYVGYKQDPAFRDQSGNGNIDTTTYPGIRDPDVKMSGIPSLGTIFSMKTFKPVHKTNACVLEMEWKLDFNIEIKDES